MELEKIKAIIAEVLNIDADSITEDTTFVDDLGADSLDIFQIITCDFRVYLGRFQLCMPQKLLDISYISTSFQ